VIAVAPAQQAIQGQDVTIDCSRANDSLASPSIEHRPLAKRPAVAVSSLSASLAITFERGVPTAVNSVPMRLPELLDSLSVIAGQHAIGRMEAADPTGASSGDVYEAPSAVVLHAAHAALSAAVSSPDVNQRACELGARYADLVRNGLWFTPSRYALDHQFAKMQERVTGVIRLELFQGRHTIVGIQSPFALTDDSQPTASERSCLDRRATAVAVRDSDLTVAPRS
jgi:argininosuccinate synthase